MADPRAGRARPRRLARCVLVVAWRAAGTRSRRCSCLVEPLSGLPPNRPSKNPIPAVAVVKRPPELVPPTRPPTANHAQPRRSQRPPGANRSGGGRQHSSCADRSSGRRRVGAVFLPQQRWGPSGAVLGGGAVGGGARRAKKQNNPPANGRRAIATTPDRQGTGSQQFRRRPGGTVRASAGEIPCCAGLVVVGSPVTSGPPACPRCAAF